MANVDRLLKLANSFSLKAEAQQSVELKQLFTTISGRIVGLAKGLAASCQHLSSKPKYNNVSILGTVKDQANKLVDIASKADANMPQLAMQQYGEIIGYLSFFGSAGNAGTGQDHALNVREDGYTEPSYYIENIDNLYRQLKGNISTEQERVTNPSNSVA